MNGICNQDVAEGNIILLSDEAYASVVYALNDPMPAPVVQLLEEESIWRG